MAMAWGLILASPVSLLLSLALFGFFDLKSRREEAWLSRSASRHTRATAPARSGSCRVCTEAPVTWARPLAGRGVGAVGRWPPGTAR
jgi:hypothetical protein